MNLDFLQDYTWYIALAHLALGIVLFFIINWIGARSVSIGYMQMNVVIQDDSAPAFNFLFKVLAPVVYLILCAVAFQLLDMDRFVGNCYFIVIDYWAFRLLWVLAYRPRAVGQLDDSGSVLGLLDRLVAGTVCRHRKGG